MELFQKMEYEVKGIARSQMLLVFMTSRLTQNNIFPELSIANCSDFCLESPSGEFAVNHLKHNAKWNENGRI